MVCSEMLNQVQHDRGGCWIFWHDRVQNVIPNLIRDLFYFVDKTKQMLLHLFLTFFLLYISRTWFSILITSVFVFEILRQAQDDEWFCWMTSGFVGWRVVCWMTCGLLDDVWFCWMTCGFVVRMWWFFFQKNYGKLLEIKIKLLYIYGTCRDGGIGRHKGLKIPRQLNDVPVRLRFSAVGCSLWTAFFYAFVFYARMRGTNSREMLILKHSL